MSKWTECRNVNLYYTSKIHKHNSLQHQNSKTIETKVCKGIDGVHKITVKFTTNPYKRFGIKQTRFAVHDLSESFVNTTGHEYVLKTESQQREELHFRTLQTATPFSSSALVSIEQSINIYSLFSKETEKKRSFTSDKVQFLHYNCAKNSKNWLKNTTLESQPKNSFKDNFFKKTLSKCL